MVAMTGSTKVGVILCIFFYLLGIGYVLRNSDQVWKDVRQLSGQVHDWVNGVDRTHEKLAASFHAAVINENIDYLQSTCLQALTPEERDALAAKNDVSIATLEYFDPRTHRVVCNLEIKTGEFTPLMTAFMAKKLKSAQALLEMGADPNNQNVVEHLLMASIDAEAMDWLALLLQYKTDANRIHEETGYSPLMFAVFSSNAEAVRLLLKAGAEINYQHPKTAISSLMLASANGLDQMVKLLIESGADVLAEDKNQRTAMEIARVHQHRKIEDFLMQEMAPYFVDEEQDVHQEL